MLGQKSTFVSMVKCLAFVVLFLFSVESSGAQTPPLWKIQRRTRRV